jgi:hypothetical protein
MSPQTQAKKQTEHTIQARERERRASEREQNVRTAIEVSKIQVLKWHGTVPVTFSPRTDFPRAHISTPGQPFLAGYL